MKKSKKKRSLKWTKGIHLNILCALLLYSSLGQNYLCSEDQEVNQLTDNEELKVTEQVKKQSRVRDLVTLKNKLKKQQRQYAQLVLRLRKAEKENEKLRFQAASLLISKSEGPEASTKLLLEDLEKKESVLRSVEGELKQLLSKLLSDPNRDQSRTDVFVETLRRTVATLKRSNSLPSLVSRRDGKSTDKMRVLSVNEDLQVVVLNAGSENGIRLGTIWNVENPQLSQAAKLRVVEVRRTICAAAVETGDVSSIKTGDVTKAGK